MSSTIRLPGIRWASDDDYMRVSHTALLNTSYPWALHPIPAVHTQRRVRSVSHRPLRLPRPRQFSAAPPAAAAHTLTRPTALLPGTWKAQATDRLRDRVLRTPLPDLLHRGPRSP
ncbi:hypothetical protein PUNSTDRAFT_55014 [Punctularia strigosozonata HHB-11173 SS5]|uniref:Uncharacterized protein n=1 Tax=Punctularia strigosozonata (strain HHB-11173) TaxID=741275 RepID=R7S5U7_PUNST|nr:uncharacterized protein PUNSTDRAFT_55014 [Punctularia strigosozonata HHB-11173 SS5]EIN05086.1 hypothetical protein PUNSTDRAFT_55014 [Punctularia strigosozonata HHB-11173 SS5]